jgi:hypothetical protein
VAFDRAQDGQASVELVAVLPLVAVVALLMWQAVVAGQAVWLSGGAARAAARAQAIGGDPAAAARSVLPRGLRAHVRVDRAAGDGVRVRIAVPVVGAGSPTLGTISARAQLRAQR